MKISIEEEVIFNDRKVAVIKFVNNNNDELILSNYGATIMAIKVQTPNKPKNDITLGFDKIEDYINSSSENNQYYFGSTIGRYANRISNACFKIKDEVIQLSKNEGKNHLHGGFNGLNKVVWNYKITENNNEIIFTYQSKSGEEGYPGNLNISLSVSFTDLGEIKLKYKATTDKPTPINLTNHVYFNLNPKKKNILKHAVTLHSDYILETDEYKIPTGNFIPVLDTDFDFNSATVLENLNQMKNEGFDHCFVLLKSNENLELVGEIAELNNLPIKKDEDLIELLSKVELDKEVPEALYKAVAEVFSFIYKASKK